MTTTKQDGKKMSTCSTEGPELGAGNMSSLRKLEKSGKSIPAWVCETHLREVDDLETSGEHSEALEVLEDGIATWPDWCHQCKENQEPFIVDLN